MWISLYGSLVPISIHTAWNQVRVSHTMCQIPPTLRPPFGAPTKLTLVLFWWWVEPELGRKNCPGITNTPRRGVFWIPLSVVAYVV